MEQSRDRGLYRVRVLLGQAEVFRRNVQTVYFLRLRFDTGCIPCWSSSRGLNALYSVGGLRKRAGYPLENN